MPDKRNPSKQRRQSRNRASRDALAARSTNAVAAPSTKTSASSSSTSTTRSSSRTAGGKATGGRSSATTSARGAARGPRPAPVAVGPPPGSIGEYFNSKRPGDRMLLIALAVSVVSALYGLFFVEVDVDDRGELLPFTFRAVALMAREGAGGSTAIGTESPLSAFGPAFLQTILLPILLMAFGLWANRRIDRARVLTFVLIALALSTMLGGGLVAVDPIWSMVSFAAVVIFGIAVFQIRKADTIAGMEAAAAAQPAAQSAASGRGGVIEADTVDDADGSADADADADAAPARPRSLLDRLLGPGAAAGGARNQRAEADEVDDDANADEPVEDAPVEDAVPVDEQGSSDRNGDDPLAELEAELAAEDEARTETPADSEDSRSGKGSSRRRR